MSLGGGGVLFVHRVAVSFPGRDEYEYWRTRFTMVCRQDPVVSHLLGWNPSGWTTDIFGTVDGHPLRLWMGNNLLQRREHRHMLEQKCIRSLGASTFHFLHTTTPAPLRLGLFVEQPMSWTFLFQVVSACGKTKYNIEKKKICLQSECQKGGTGTLDIGFGGLYIWPGTLLAGKVLNVWGLKSVGWSPVSGVCEAVVSKICLL